MPLTVDSILWEATGHVTANPVTVTHPDGAGTTEGSTVILVARSVGSALTPPAGWATDLLGSLVGLYAYRLENVAGGVTSWAFNRGSAGNVAWYMAEVDHLDPNESFEVVASTNQAALGNGGTRSTNTTALNAGSGVLALGVWGSTKAAGGDTHSWSGYTNGFTERADFNPAGVAGNTLAVAAKAIEGQGTFECTATFAVSSGTPSAGAMILIYRAHDATINAPLAYHTGFEFGTHAGMGNLSNSPLGTTLFSIPDGTFGTNWSVDAGSARNGGFGLRTVASAVAVSVPLPTVSAGTLCFAANVKAVSGSGTPKAVHFNNSGSPDLWLVYDVATEKFGLQWSSGSAEWQTGTTPLGTWAWIEVAERTNSATYHAKWWIETGTGDGFQTSPADPTGAATGSSVHPTLGWATSQTATFDFDDVVYSRHYGAFPLGPHVVRLLVPETTGATVSGTSTNFRRFTANGTLATVDGTEGALLDEVPPTVSASSDGVVQVSNAASDYIDLPMTTYTCAANEIIAGVRFVASEWGGTGSGTGTLGWRGHDGLTETTFQAAGALYDADSLTAASATYPRWIAATWSGAQNGAWTQERLDDAAIQMGFSTDATPDMGASAVYLEVATREISNSWTVHRLTDDEDPEVNAAVVSQTLHPYNSGVRTFSVSNDDPTRTAVFNYSIGGTPQTPVVVAPSDPPVDITVGAEAFGEIESTSFGWQ